jgi:hypothetical protein
MKHNLLPLKLGIATCLLVGVSTQPAKADLNPVVLPPGHSYPHVYTYGELTARWWQWFISIPAANSPGAGGACRTGQLGRIWFLAGLATGPGTVECTVPHGTMLFFPIINTECSNLEGPPFFGATPAERRACAKAIVDGAADLSVTIDGKPLRNPAAYRVASPDFMITAPPGNVLGTDPASGLAAGDGFYLLVAPLLPNKTHEIRIRGSFPAFMFSIDTTFKIKVSN